MIKIVQWGTSRSLCKVYNKDTQDNFESVTLMLVDNQYLVNLESHVQVLDYPIKREV